MKHISTNACLVACLVIAMSYSAAAANPVSAEWAASWQADLDFVAEQLPATHAKYDHTISQEDFAAALHTLRGRVPKLSHHEITVELAAIVASIGDGHTRLTLPMVDGAGFAAGHSSTPPPTTEALLFHHFPLRLYLYDDGLYVQKIGAENAAWAGAKVLRIGDYSAEEAMAAVRRVIHHDNEMQIDLLLPSRLVMPEVLHALGIIENREHATYVLETASGSEHELNVRTVAAEEEVSWVSADDSAPHTPLYLRDRDSHYWFEYVAEERAVYWQYNEVYDQEDETIVAFATRLTDFIADNEVEKLVLDLRFNSGGDNAHNRPLLHALIRSPELRSPGSFYVIVGRGTFSAAMMFALDLEEHTSAIFVGEPTGAKVNSYGDSRKLQLPNTGLTIRASTLYWQYSDPRDERASLVPHLTASMSSSDFANGRDPAVAQIWQVSSTTAPTAELAGQWAGRFMEYSIVVNLERDSDQWQATIDFPDHGAEGLPLVEVSYNSPTLRFDFPNGDDIISFQGEIMADVVVGGLQMQGQTYPWAARRLN